MGRREVNPYILVVDDTPSTLEVIRRNLLNRGFQVLTAMDVPAALDILAKMPIDLVITDFRMPGQSGLDLVRHVRENHAGVEVLMITGYPSVQGAVEALRHGAEDYLAKPFTDEELQAAVDRALDKLKLKRLIREEPPLGRQALKGFIGESEALKTVFDDIAKVASSSATVLVTGDSGTGKELVARAIHYSGNRASAPFIPVNCGGIPETLLESELFGHTKGAFTGASGARAGFFQAAEGGTIFMDEVSEMSIAMQVKILRVLQEKEIPMVGSSRPRKIDVRVIAATNKDLHALVKKGLFREDLYFRLNVIRLTIPPLRDRGDDIILLARHFAAKYAVECGRPVPAFSDSALRTLRDYAWPGNVRELENVIHRLVVMGEGERIDVPDLPELMRFSALRGESPYRTLAEIEAEHIRRVMGIVGGNRTRAAEILGVDRKTLREKLKRLGPEEEGDGSRKG
ncbi:MAG TPA: sigma-54 dependent transcriptional regulator [Holophaga sp.]|nr:sigma-54 dependent transcriptional regulator [Holophaga sp.]HPS67294.1 sigma-54 dependent transcriptional regulator [Holophaga sp.]